MQREFGIEFPLVEAIAESVPLPDACFDLAVSEYGASIWADPSRWIPEAARLLRPEGRLVFLRNSPLSILCMKLEGISESLQRAQRGMNRIEWPDTGEVEFHLPHSELLDLLRGTGFDVERLIELYAPEDAETHRYYGYVTAEWAQKWPAEEIWVAHKRE
jgi:ubiquinone/menaquinone biosynthesis C-methylase UbiE